MKIAPILLALEVVCVVCGIYVFQNVAEVEIKRFICGMLAFVAAANVPATLKAIFS